MINAESHDAHCRMASIIIIIIAIIIIIIKGNLCTKSNPLLCNQNSRHNPYLLYSTCCPFAPSFFPIHMPFLPVRRQPNTPAAGPAPAAAAAAAAAVVVCR